MTQRSLHPAPRYRDVVLEQIRIAGLALRPAALILAALFGTLTVVIAIDIVRGRADTWFDTGEWAPLLLLSFLLPFAVWRRDRRFGPAFLWTLPVDRRRLALAKVFAGWVWLFTTVAVLIIWQRALALISGVAEPQTVPLIALAGTTAAYLLSTAVVVGLRYPLRWLFGAVAFGYLVAMLREVTRGRYGIDALVREIGVEDAIDRAYFAWRDLPDVPQWAITIVFWIGTAAALLLAAVSRHRERRRR